MPEPTENPIADSIGENASMPQQHSVDGVNVREHSLRDQIEADLHLSERRSARKRKLPIRLVKIRPGGSI